MSSIELVFSTPGKLIKCRIAAIGVVGDHTGHRHVEDIRHDIGLLRSCFGHGLDGLFSRPNYLNDGKTCPLDEGLCVQLDNGLLP
jgi:hypothetical protein